MTDFIAYPVVHGKPNTLAVADTVGCDYSNDTSGLVLGVSVDSAPGTYEDDKAMASSADKIEPIVGGQDAFWDTKATIAEFKVGNQAILVVWGDVVRGSNSQISAASARSGAIRFGKAVITKFFPSYAR